jgi:ribonuclease J
VVAVSLAIDEAGKLADDPQAVLDGLPEETDSGVEFHELVLDATEDLFDAIPRKRRQLDEVVTEGIAAGHQAPGGNRVGQEAHRPRTDPQGLTGKSRAKLAVSRQITALCGIT